MYSYIKTFCWHCVPNKHWPCFRLTQDVRPDMALNFDQDWKSSWSSPTRLLHKVFDVDCPQRLLTSRRERVAAIIHGMQPAKEEPWTVKRRRISGPFFGYVIAGFISFLVQWSTIGCAFVGLRLPPHFQLSVFRSTRPLAGKDARADNVGQSRHSVTLVTSLWGSGEAGPLCIVLPLGFQSAEQQLQLQQRFAPDIFFISSGQASHFMRAETVVEYFEHVLAPAFHRRRTILAERYGRSFDDEKGFLLADAFTGHHSTSGGTDVQRAWVPIGYIWGYISIYLSIYLSIHLSIYLSIPLSLYIKINLYNYIYIFICDL